MKQLLITIAAVVLVGCGNPDRALIEAARDGNIEAVKQAIANGVDVNAKNRGDATPLHGAAANGHKEIAELLMANGAKINSIYSSHEETDSELDFALSNNHQITTDFLRKKGAKTAEELKAEVK